MLLALILYMLLCFDETTLYVTLNGSCMVLRRVPRRCADGNRYAESQNTTADDHMRYLQH